MRQCNEQRGCAQRHHHAPLSTLLLSAVHYKPVTVHTHPAKHAPLQAGELHARVQLISTWRICAVLLPAAFPTQMVRVTSLYRIDDEKLRIVQARTELIDLCHELIIRILICDTDLLLQPQSKHDLVNLGIKPARTLTLTPGLAPSGGAGPAADAPPTGSRC